jgi:hypothetical protein
MPRRYSWVIMTIFAVLLPSPQPALVEAIKKHYPADHFGINETQWLISAAGTTIDLSAKLGIYDPKAPSSAAIGSAVILATSSYFGRAPTPLWDWMKAKLEAAPSA